MTIEDIEHFETYYFDLNKRFLKFVGLGSYQKPKQQFVRNCIVNSIFITGFLLEMYEFYTQRLNLDLITRHLEVIVPSFCCFCCYNAGAYHSQVLIQIIEHMKFDIIVLKDEREKMILRKYFDRNRISTKFITVFVYVYYVLTVLPSILYATFLISGTMNDSRIVLPLPTQNLVNTKMQYYGMLLYQVVFILLTDTVITATYTSYIAFVLYACALLAIVILKINAPFVDDLYDKHFLKSDTSHVGYDSIIDVVKSYVNAVEFVKLINILSETAYLFAMGSSMLMIIIGFLYISEIFFSEYKDIAEIGKCIGFSGSTTFIIYINCYVGQMLIDHNTAVSTELRQIPFYKISGRAQKLLPSVILQCSKPCALMIGGLFLSGHEFFSGLLQTSISYAMVFHTMR